MKRLTFADFSTVAVDKDGSIYLEAKTKKDGYLTDYFNAIRTAFDLEEENQSFQKMAQIRNLQTPEDQWCYCENNCSGNENDEYCWINTKQYTPSFLLNKSTGKLYLHYILDPFNPDVEMELDELIELLEVWKSEYIKV